MSFFDDMLPVIGGVGGAIFGGPAGAMVGAGLGGRLSGLTRGSPDNPYDKLSYVGPKPGQGFTPSDLFSMEKARRMGEGEAQGRQGALEQRMSAQAGSTQGPGKWMMSQQAGQGAVDRNSLFDLGRAGVAADRDAQNAQALNDFNMRHMMLSSGYGERANAADTANRDNLFNDIGAMGMYSYGRQKKPDDSSGGSLGGVIP